VGWGGVMRGKGLRKKLNKKGMCESIGKYASLLSLDVPGRNDSCLLQHRKSKKLSVLWKNHNPRPFHASCTFEKPSTFPFSLFLQEIVKQERFEG